MIEKQVKLSENFLTGIADYYFTSKSSKSKDKRLVPPLWMKFKLHQKEWKEGWAHAKKQDINTQQARLDRQQISTLSLAGSTPALGAK